MSSTHALSPDNNLLPSHEGNSHISYLDIPISSENYEGSLAGSDSENQESASDVSDGAGPNDDDLT